MLRHFLTQIPLNNFYRTVWFLKRSICATLPAVVLAFSANSILVESALACKPKRLLIPVAQYAGAESGSAKNEFQLFIGILSKKIKLIKKQFSKLKYIENLDLLYAAPGRKPFRMFDDDNEALAYWKTSNSLEILQGEIWLRSTVPYASSRIVIGDLRGSYPDAFVTLRLPITDDGAPATLDSHSMVTYFALAEDAKLQGCEEGIVNGFISKARSALSDLEKKMNDGRGLRNDVNVIKNFKKILTP